MTNEEIEILENLIGWSLPADYREALSAVFSGVGLSGLGDFEVCIATFYNDLLNGSGFGLQQEWLGFKSAGFSALSIALTGVGNRIILHQDGLTSGEVRLTGVSGSK